MLKSFRKMKQLIITLAFIACNLAASAQDFQVFRAEGVPFDNRHDALVGGDYSKSSHYIEFKPKAEAIVDGAICMGQNSEFPYVWSDGLIMIHLEAVGQAYSLWINGNKVAYNEDGFTPTEYDITSFAKQGENHIQVQLHAGKLTHTQQDFELPCERFTGSYLFSQQRRSIKDYTIRLTPDSLRRFGVLELDIIARNEFNYEEVVNPSYDIYAPTGKLMDYTDHPITIAGRSVDTVHLTPFIYHTNEQKWGMGKAPLYRVMLFTKRDGKMWEYMPLRVGFNDVKYIDGEWQRFGEKFSVKPYPFNAMRDRATTKKGMENIIKAGFNTLKPSFPQPHWYYELADEMGLYVIDCAAINAPDKRDNRRVGGTPANDPTLAEEFTRRVKAMYYRSRNHTCIIGFSIANPSGNGYALYKAYEWIKSVERERPVFYEDARGEWNSD